jgi:tetratricopeptide (TPR) repeat protein
MNYFYPGGADWVRPVSKASWQVVRVIRMSKADDRSKLQTALAHYQAGRLDKAAELYRKIIGRDSRNFQALYYLGIVEARGGNLKQAASLLARALAIEPANGPLLENYATILIQIGDYQTALGISQQVLQSKQGDVYCLYLGAVSLLKLGRLQESLLQYDKLLAIEPKHFVALNERGSALAAMGRFDVALDSFGRSLALQPRYAEAHVNKGNVCATLSRWDDAFAAFDKALALKPDLGEAWLGRGNILRELKRYDEAFAAFEKALTIRPAYAEAWLGRGNTSFDLRRYDDALAAYDKALAFNPPLAEAWRARAAACRELRRHDEAVAACDKALALNPDFAEAWLGRGDVLFLLNRDDEAVSCFDKAISLKADLADAYWNKSLVRLSLGQYEEGWQLYEWRWKLRSFTSPRRSFRQPLWLGDHAVDNKTILIHSEQGLGDTIHFCRYLSFLDGRDCRVVLETPKPLVPLFQARHGSIQVVATGDALPDFDVHCPLLSLPLACKTTLDTIPASVPYLCANDEKVAAWRGRMGARTKPRIGLVWSGGLHPVGRSLPLQALSPVLVDSVEWNAITKDIRDHDREYLAQNPLIKDRSHWLADFADTAALVAEMDLVISVDTAVAHLAGALGKPVWVLLQFHPDFRWLRDRQDSPWYPTARLFRQTKADQWGDVVERVAIALREFLPGVAMPDSC